MSHYCFMDVSKMSTWSVFSFLHSLFPHVCVCVCLLVCSRCHGNNGFARANYRADSKRQRWDVVRNPCSRNECKRLHWRQVMESHPVGFGPAFWNSWHLLAHPYSICKGLNVFHVQPHNPAAEEDMFPNVSWWEFVSYESGSFARFHVYLW